LSRLFAHAVCVVLARWRPYEHRVMSKYALKWPNLKAASEFELATLTRSWIRTTGTAIQRWWVGLCFNTVAIHLESNRFIKYYKKAKPMVKLQKW